jgi:four helix bundle protein
MAMKANMYGHRRMVVWQNLDRIEMLVQRKILKLIPNKKFQLIDQIDRACSSCGANFIEGYYSGSIKEYVRFLSYSKRSLAELQDWVRRAFYKGFVPEQIYLEFDDLAIKTMFLLNRLINSLRLKSRNSPKPSKPS